MTPSISHEAVKRFVNQLDHRILQDPSPSYLPIVLPLALPSPLHTVNFFTTLHLIHDVLSSPSHAAYFVESGTTPRDTAIRGTISLFLGSEESWNADNLLSTAAWKTGRLDERAIAEHFEIKVVRERKHETMKAIRVGERWDKAAAVAQALVTLFADLGDRLHGRCVGEAVSALVHECSQQADGSASAFAEAFGDQAAQLVPSIGGSAPLHLLQDLARRQADTKDLDLSLPAPTDLADVAPLPLPLPVLLRYGIIDLVGMDASFRSQVGSHLMEPFDQAATTTAEDSTLTAVTLPLDELKDLAKTSIEACTLIQQECRNATDAWKTRLSHQDVWRVCAFLEERMVRQGQGFMLVPL